MPTTLAPTEAAAFYALGLLPSSALPRLATAWLVGGRDSPSMRVLAGEAEPIMSEVGPLFESALQEVSVKIPDPATAVLRVLEIYVQQIATGGIDPFDGMMRIDNDLDRTDLFPNTNHVGDGLGLERMYTWYRELQDAKDGSRFLYYTHLPREEAVVRFREHLIEEARRRLLEFDQP